jgi:YjbE family integral membrane protein
LYSHQDLKLHFLVANLFHSGFWVVLGQIALVNIILSGDNAVVIALACMTLPPRQRVWGMVLGAGVAVLLRVLFTLVVARAMTYPFLKIIGGLLLFWIALKLIVQDEVSQEGKIEAADNLWRAVQIIAIADVVMSLDNVIAIAASAETAAAQTDAAHHDLVRTALIIFGLATSIPLIVAGSAVLMALLKRYKVLIWAGGALLGWVAGDIIITDPAIVGWIGDVQSAAILPWGARLGAALIVCLALYLVARQRPLTGEDMAGGISLMLWLLGDAVVVSLVTESSDQWVLRGAVSVALILGYFYFRRFRLEKAGP